MDKFTGGYIEALFWSNSDKRINAADMTELAPGVWDTLKADCAAFQRDARDLLDLANEAGRDDAHLGHDYALTRNGHGAGFWDRGLGELGEQLTRYAKRSGGCDLYVGDNGKIYAERA